MRFIMLFLCKCEIFLLLGRFEHLACVCVCGGGVIKRSFETGSHNVVQVDFELVASLLSQYPSLLLWEGGPDKNADQKQFGRRQSLFDL